jgi:hypothetical protein
MPGLRGWGGSVERELPVFIFVSLPDPLPYADVNPGLLSAHFRRTPPITSCMSTPLLLSIEAAMKSAGSLRAETVIY